MRNSSSRARLVTCMAIFAAATTLSPVAALQDFDQTSCDHFLAEVRTVGDRRVGPVSCLMQETNVRFDGRDLRRLDIGLDGSVEGFLFTGGMTRGLLTNAPALVLPQAGDSGSASFAIADYRRDKGASMTLFYPLSREQWNGKLWVTAHGEGQSFSGGQLAAWHKNLDRAKPLHDLSAFDRLILAKGYALAKTRRTSRTGSDDLTTRLENGTTVDGVSLQDSAAYVSDLTRLAKRALADRLGQAPGRTYLYGHSAGASLARGVNYAPGLNASQSASQSASPFFDGILADQALGGAWLPIDLPAAGVFVPQIDVLHQLYSTPWRGSTSDPLSTSPLVNGRTNATLLQEKGLGARSRTYEVRGVGLNGVEQVERNASDDAIDLARIMDRVVDHLDAWVDRGVEPPASRSDSLALGDTNGDGRLDHPAIAFPEVACPLGVHVSAPALYSPGTGFIAFGGDELEPLDTDAGFVDMNRNAIRDRRESPTQAWRRLGLLKPGEELSRDRYRECVQGAAERLRQDGFFSDSTVRLYLERAATAAFPSARR